MGVILKEKYINSLVEIKRVFDRIMTMKLGIEGVISAYNPQVGCELEENNLERSRGSGSKYTERIVMGTDCNGDVGERNNGDEHEMGIYEV